MTSHQLRYGLPVDDQEAARLTHLINDLPEAHREKVAEALASAVVSYHRTGDTGVLAQFARDLTTTVELRRDPDYLRASAAAPVTSSGRGRSVKEIFAETRT